MNGNLLLVDDEAALLEMMKELLQDDHWQIFTAPNGKEGLKILGERRIDCVVSDLKMPVMDGFGFIEKAREEGHEMPFIFYSGHACEKLEKMARALGACDLLSKPQFDELEKAIRVRMGKPAVQKELIAQF